MLIPYLFLSGVLKDSGFLIRYPSYGCEVSSFFPSMFLSSDSREDSNGASSSSFFILFLLRWIQYKLSVLIIFFFSFQVLSYAGAPLNHSLLGIPSFSSVKYISKGSSCLSRSVQPISRLLSHYSHLIQPVQSLFKNRSMVFPFEWALTHRSFPRIFPDSPNFPGAVPKFFSKFDVRMNFISQIVSKAVFKFFSSLAQTFSFNPFGVSQQFMVVFLVVILGF